MSDQQPQPVTKSSYWFFSDYTNQDISSHLSSLTSDIQKSQTAVNKRLEALEHNCATLLQLEQDISNKLDKLILSNHNIIKYLSQTSAHDAREINYRIRAASVKNNPLPPSKFMPEPNVVLRGDGDGNNK